MTLEEARQKLNAALPLRTPLLDPHAPGRAKVEALEDYMATASFHRGELEEALVWVYDAGAVLRHEWEQIEGYEVALPRGDRTQAAVNEAKRTIDPGTWQGIQEAKHLVDRIGGQIRKLEKDDATVSRLYTLITGRA